MPLHTAWNKANPLRANRCAIHHEGDLRALDCQGHQSFLVIGIETRYVYLGGMIGEWQMHPVAIGGSKVDENQRFSIHCGGSSVSSTGEH